tara:strand:+ start:256 stop:678 length:423 start_codon:yes stop_codon:yes gene_type:complete
MAEKTIVEKLFDELGEGPTGNLRISDKDKLKTAFEIIDGVDEVRANLMVAAFGDPDDPNDEGGHLDKTIGKDLGLSAAAAKDFTANSVQRMEYVNKVAAESADMSHAKAEAMWAAALFIVRYHIMAHHDGVSWSTSFGAG